MEHLLLKAATTATTDQGYFAAIAAAYTVDRVKDRIVPGAFKGTIEHWQKSGKQIPLHWNHEGDPKSIIGAINPAAVKETDDGLYVEGKLDLQDSEMAREAWRSMKNGTMSLSFGYMVNDAREAKGGITELLAIDLFEVSIVPAPANADTRVLSLKSVEVSELSDSVKEWLTSEVERIVGEKFVTQDQNGRTDKSVDPLRETARKLALDVRSGGLSTQPPPVKQAPEPKPEPEMDPGELRQRSRDLMIQVLSGS